MIRCRYQLSESLNYPLVMSIIRSCGQLSESLNCLLVVSIIWVIKVQSVGNTPDCPTVEEARMAEETMRVLIESGSSGA
jgi:hypothetical protein